MDILNSQKTPSSTSKRSFLLRSLSRRDGGDLSSIDAKGPFGLNTLYNPSSPAITDLIFVHGLRGGSRSTWTKSGDPSLYWPQEWLPHDSDFQDVRIHSFGYDSDWDKESILNLHDFAKSLLGSIQDCPLIPHGSDTPIVFVGHSMGGLVIKRAYILAKQKKDFVPLATRVRTIFFLAAPHRGADLAQVLTRILRVFPGARPFVADLHRNSIATQSINDEFPQHCRDLQLYSFYETLPTNYGFGKGLVVDKDSATLGYSNERTAYLNANHRGVCKFAAQTDSNYRTVRNALASTIGSIRDHAISSTIELKNEQHCLLDSIFGVSDAPEDDFLEVDTMRLGGSCEWLVTKTNFKEWQDSSSSQMYWITAKPGSGKTVLSGKIVHHLKCMNRDLTFYFFDYRNKSKTAINAFLLSMAWQMAYIHSEVLQRVLEICKNDDQLRKAGYWRIWRKLFVECILRMNFDRPQYWVIDALDECKANSELVPLLLKVVEVCSIRILLTSRDRFESYRQRNLPEVMVVSENVSEDDTKSDIKLFIEASRDQLPSIDEEAQQNMVTKILTKSGGCFLWVSLVLQELKRVHTSAEIRQVLEEIPSDMNELYSRILDSMSTAPYGKKLAKAILSWTVCSARPLTTTELYHALQIDLGDSIDSVERSILSTCGHLVYVDVQSRVQLVHQTARDFLLRAGSLSEFAIDELASHKRIVTTCLQYLNGKEMQVPKHRSLSASNVVKQRCPFVTYACNSFFEHIAHVSSTDNDIVFALAKFLSSSNVLAWIEYLAIHSDLSRLIQTGQALEHFLQRRPCHLSPPGGEVALLNSWAVDLIRLVTKFGEHLLSTPSSIFHVIPPFCPPETAVRKQFAETVRGISILGLSATTWDDCLSTVGKASERFSALACCDRYFSIGMASGNIVVYNEATCQEIRSLQHQEAVQILHFGKRTDLLASSGLKIVRMWETSSWDQLWELEIEQPCIEIAFMEERELLLGAFRNNILMSWDLVTGALRDSADWTLGLGDSNPYSSNWPRAVAFCVESSLLAVAYKYQDVLLWDLAGGSFHGLYSKETGYRFPGPGNLTPGARGLIFSRISNAGLLAASWADGELVVFDTSERTVRATTVANAHTLACSPDGRTLACGHSGGTILLFDFETLKLLYRIDSDGYGIQQLVFNGNSLRLLGIRGSHCRIWEPTVLARQDGEEENRDLGSGLTAAQEVGLWSSENVTQVTSLVCHGQDGVAFCGTEKGSVYLYETKSGRQARKLFIHPYGGSIMSLYLDEETHALVILGSGGLIIVHRLVRWGDSWDFAETIFSHRPDLPLYQVISNKGFTRLLVSTGKKDTLWSISPEESTIVNEIPREGYESHMWQMHPSRQDHLIYIRENIAHIYEWQTLQQLTGGEGILLEGSILPELSIRSMVPCCSGTIIATTFSDRNRLPLQSKLLLWDSADFSASSKSAAPIPRYCSLADQIKTIIGERGQKLIFLHNNNWVCSTNLQSSPTDNFVYHFFLPADWLSRDADLIFGIANNGDILFVKKDEVAVIKRGLENVELGPHVPGKRLPLLGGSDPSLQVPESF